MKKKIERFQITVGRFLGRKQLLKTRSFSLYDTNNFYKYRKMLDEMVKMDGG